MNISNKKIAIATHYLVYGAPQALREYLIKNEIQKLFFISHPLQVDKNKSYFELVINGEIKKKHICKIRFKFSVLNYFFEIFLTLKWMLKDKDKFDLFVGVDPLNSFMGIILKKINKIEKLIFYTIDYVPKRFDNTILNNIYHWLDKLAVVNADEIWNVSPRIAEARRMLHASEESDYKQKVVPIGVWFDRVKRLPFDRVKKHQILFVGHLLEKQGVQLVLDTLPEIINFIPDIHFLVVGGGEYEGVLRAMVAKLNLEDYVTFTGWIRDRSKLDQIMADSAIAIAMYNKEKDDFTYYADPTKLKDYLSAGLPIILTDLPHNAREIKERRCGVMIDYDKKEFAQAVISLMQDESKLKTYRDNAREYARQFDWDLIFSKNLENILL